ncbi:hypothetical protein evm_010520 [Chilo suppressalis]|nr:hypothetical protein evm_010520 [Chilo suppressalis]
MGNRSIKKNKRKRARLRELREHMNNIRVQRHVQKDNHNENSQTKSTRTDAIKEINNDDGKKYYLYGTTGTFSNLTHTADILESNENDGTLNDSEKTLLDLDLPVTLTNTVNILNSNYSEAVDPELHTEKTCEEDAYEPVHGRRIIDINSFYKQIQTISNHNSLFDCNFSHISLLGERRTGLISKLKLKCNMCQKDFIITSEDTLNKHDVNVNIAAAIEITSAGIGYSQFEEMTASINIPIFTEVTYSRLQDQVYEKWELTAVDSMAVAAKREIDAAIAEGKLTRDGIPVIDVYADACWSARSYGNNYKALSEAAAIVGRRFSEVLFLGIKNKYCLVCARAEKKQTEIPNHIWFKNYTGSSSGMESEIICQGFETSISMYNIVYGRLIADGDSATYAKILARNPYPTHTVKKIECRNHVLRNMCNKLKTLSTDTKYPLAHRKTLTQVKILSFRKVVLKSIEKHKLEKEKPEALAGFRNDVQNSVRHAYGDHAKCNNYYCLKAKTTQSHMEIENTLLWFRMQTIIQSVVSKSKSMLEDVDANTVERFNSVIAKIVGGKRINFSLRRGYQARCNAAVVSFNNPYPRHLLKKTILGKSPKKSVLKRFEERRLAKRKLNKERPHQKNRMLKTNNVIQNDYGVQSIKPDLSPQELNIAKENFLQNLKQLTSDKEKIQLSTFNQRDMKRRENTSKAKLVENILYKSNINNVAAIAHGVENEGLALKQLAIQEKVVIAPCGLFIDDEYPFIGATPDGLIGQDTIVEIKCPIVAFKKGLDESIKDNKIQMWRLCSKTQHKPPSMSRNRRLIKGSHVRKLHKKDWSKVVEKTKK